MNARKNNHEVIKGSVPQDVGKTSKDGTTGSPVALRVREGIVRNPRDRGVHRLPKLTTEPLTLALVPVLDRRQVELRRSTEEDRYRQRRRCSRRAFTSDQGL